MAMAPSASAAAVAAPLLLLSLLASTAAAARAVGADSVQEACSKTQFPKLCADSLAAKPEAQKATPRRLAELFVNIAAEKGAGMATFVHGKYNGAKDDSALFKCYDSCSDDVEEAVAHLNGLVREPTDGKFLELKSWLSSTLGGASTCEDACKDLPKSSDKDDVVSFSLDFEKLQRITLDLITEASGSMSADIALPPSDAAAAPAYGAGAAAPPLGASAEAPAGSEGPASASGPSAGDAPPAYGAAASGPAAADAPASSSSGAASAPSPSSSESTAGAPGPASDDSSSAPAPSGGDDDGDDDDADGDDVGGSA